MEFEVDKKYQINNAVDKTIYECVKVKGPWAILVWYDYAGVLKSFSLPKHPVGNYVEYIEPPKPIVHERWVIWYKYNNSSTMHVCIRDVRSTFSGGAVVVKEEKVTYTEHPDTCNGNCTCAGGQPCCKKGCKA